MAKLFPVVMRGFDKTQVEEVFARADNAIADGDATRRAAAREELGSTVFQIGARGYSPTDVAMAVEQRLAALSS
ncbi:hypothetical protein KIH74_16840 [Kineosporia sp. J2-2]|uniref:DivIVA domain-containing protein n=1 Tax=Kineosporia corallincola TaxID=2835133 RepID=A0ABS5THR7_9ACTN|nr:hypothetical protein [Kineosporia corallincola]MBT0770612.1 hypothetical protein [Kineosporia corallincola]